MKNHQTQKNEFAQNQVENRKRPRKKAIKNADKGELQI